MALGKRGGNFLNLLQKGGSLRKGQGVSNPRGNHAETFRKAIDDNEFACGVFLSFKKAFDTVNHGISFKKM